MFKIVQTISDGDGEPELSIVSSAWERNNLLFWPKTGSERKQQDPNSKPGKNWLQQKCTLKRWNLSKSEAEEEITRMGNYSDTDNPIEQRNKTKTALLKNYNNEIATSDVSTYCYLRLSDLLL